MTLMQAPYDLYVMNLQKILIDMIDTIDMIDIIIFFRYSDHRWTHLKAELSVDPLSAE